jgi:hypothetical protein
MKNATFALLVVGHSRSNNVVTFPTGRGDSRKRDFRERGVSNIIETRPPMNNSKLVIFLSCLFAATLTAPLVKAAAHGGGHGGGFSGGHSFAGRPGMGMPGRPGMPGMGMPGRPGMGMPGMGMPGRFGMGMPGRPGMGGMPGRPGMGMRSGFNRHDHFDHHHDHFHHHEDEDNDFIFIGSFGFPGGGVGGGVRGGGWGPGGGWGYPYGYYGGYGAYGSGYGSAYSSGSRVTELQRRLARAGYYHGSIDGVLGSQTRRAIRAYERDHGYGS